MTIETSIIFIISLFLLWIKPGPGQAFKITRALNDGFLPAFFVVVGIITACLFYFLVAVLGLKIVTEFFQNIGPVLKVVGGVYFLYVGYQGLKNIKSGQWQGRVSKSTTRNFVENFSAGFLLSLSNPLDIIYFLGIMPTLVPVGAFTLNDILLGMTLVAGVALLVDLMVLLLVGQVKEALSNTSFVKRINIVTSVGFILIALFLFYSALFMSNFSYEMI